MQPIEDRVRRALGRAPREGFLPRAQRSRANEDMPLPIAGGQTNSQPSTVLAMLELLDPPEGASVLDVGAGSGWTTALLGHLVGPQGRVLGLELEAELVDFGAANVAAADLPWARLEQADPEMLGRPGDGPYDRILVSAMASEFPRELAEQLTDDGLLVVPVAGRMIRARRTSDGLEVDDHGAYRFVPLR